MIQFYACLFFVVIIFYACKNPSNPSGSNLDRIPPEVTISNLKNDSTVTGIANIVCEAHDNVGILRVELIVDSDSTGIIDKEKPYILLWDTRSYKKDSYHKILVKAIDVNNNIGYSDTLRLKIDNSLILKPIPTYISNVSYNRTQMLVSWHKTQIDNFAYYELFQSNIEEGNRISLVIKQSIEDTTHILTEFNPNQENWFWITITDTLGYSATSNSFMFLNHPPGSSIINPVLYQDHTFTIEWTKNNDNDFYMYEIYESDSPQMDQSQLIYNTVDKNDTVFITPTIPYDEIRYYQVKTFDYGDLFSASISRRASSYQKIVYNVNQMNKIDIYIMDFDGQEKICLTDNPDYDGNPEFSPDGSHIIYDATINGNRDIYIVNTIGKNRKRLTSNSGNDGMPKYSNDGSKIIFTSERDGDREIYIMNADGSNQKRLTTNSGVDEYPVFLRDDSRIIYSSERNFLRDLYMININSSDEIQLTTNGLDEVEINVSPVDDKIVYVYEYVEPTIKSDIYILDIPTKQSINLTNASPNEMNRSPVFDSDGNKIYYLLNYEIYVMETNGSNKTNITQGEGTISELDVSYDKNSIVFNSTKDGNPDIYIINLNDLHWNRLTEDNYFEYNIKFQRRH